LDGDKDVACHAVALPKELLHSVDRVIGTDVNDLLMVDSTLGLDSIAVSIADRPCVRKVSAAIITCSHSFSKQVCRLGLSGPVCEWLRRVLDLGV
jgi:hypothetical protein